MEAQPPPLTSLVRCTCFSAIISFPERPTSLSQHSSQLPAATSLCRYLHKSADIIAIENFPVNTVTSMNQIVSIVYFDMTRDGVTFCDEGESQVYIQHEKGIRANFPTRLQMTAEKVTNAVFADPIFRFRNHKDSTLASSHNCHDDRFLSGNPSSTLDGLPASIKAPSHSNRFSRR